MHNKLWPEFKWDLHRVSITLCQVPIWLSPLLVSISSLAIEFEMIVAWVVYNGSCLLGETVTTFTINVEFEKKWWTSPTSVAATTSASCKQWARQHLVRNPSVSLSPTLTRNEKVEHHIRIKAHKPIALRFWVESGVNILCGWAQVSLVLCLPSDTPSLKS